MKISLGDLRSVIREVLENDVESQIEELQAEPEFKDLETFVAMKLDNEEHSYDFVELQALARNIDAAKIVDKKRKISSASPAATSMVRNELDGYGLTFVAREAIKKTRGFTSSVHGTSPFAGMSGGSGIGDGGLRMGGGPGAMGSGERKITFKR